MQKTMFVGFAFTETRYTAPKSKTPPAEQEAFWSRYQSKSEDLRYVLLDGRAGHCADLVTGNAEVAEFAVGHTIQLGNGLTILAPIAERACEVHGHLPSFKVCRNLYVRL